MRRNDECRAENFITGKKRYRKWIVTISILSIIVAVGTLYLLNKPATAVSEDGASSVGMVLGEGSSAATVEASANDGHGQDAVHVASVTEGTSEDGSSVSSTSASSASTASSASDAGVARSVSGVVLTGVFTDQNGKKIHEDTKLSVSDVLDLTAAPEKIEGYQYQKATINDKTVKSIRKITSSDVSAAGSEAGEGESGSAASATYMYVMEDDSEVKVTEDTEIDFLYEAVSDARAVSVKATLVDEFGNEIDADRYSDIALPAFDRDGVLHLDDAENPPYEDVRVKTGLFKSVKYSFEKATIGETIITGIKRCVANADNASDVSAKDSSISLIDAAAGFISAGSIPTGSEVTSDSTVQDNTAYTYYYTTDNATWTEITENTVIEMTYADGKKTKYEFEDDTIKVTATLQKSDAIPDDAELIVTPVTEKSTEYNYKAYMKALNDHASEIAKADSENSEFTEDTDITQYSDENTLLYDIAFMETDAETGVKTEVEPAEGTVAVSIEMKDKQLQKQLGINEAEQLTVIHLPLKDEALKGINSTAAATDITSDDVEIEKIEAPKVSIDNTEAIEYNLSSMSLTALTVSSKFPGDTKDWLKFTDGTYYTFNNSYSANDLKTIGKSTSDIVLEYHYISDDSETFVKTKYYNADSALGIAGNFHMVAFKQVKIGADLNGNVLTSSLNRGDKDEFGTWGYEEAAYISGKYDDPAQRNLRGSDKNILALGSSNVITVSGNSFEINGKRVEKPKVIYKDGSKKFIDIDSVESDAEDISNQIGSLASTVGSNISVNDSKTVFSLNDPNGLAVVKLTADEVTAMSTDVKFTGFKSNSIGTIIINVDMKNASSVDLPDRALMYIDGVKQGTNETTTFKDGKIIWNFTNCSNNPTIHLHNMTGTVIALGASIEADQNLNGTMIADYIHNTAETHRSDFIGKTTGDSTAFGVTKTFTNGIWPLNGVYNIVFERASARESGPLPSTMALSLSKDNSTGSFGNIAYPYESSYNGETVNYYYVIREDRSNPIADVTYDGTYYYVKVSVKYTRDSSGNKSASIIYTGYSKQTSVNNSYCSLKYSSFDKNDSLSTFVFNNSYQATKDITVNKMWTGDTDNKGVAVTRWNVTLKLFDNAGKEVQKDAESKTVAPYTMTVSDQSAANMWSHTFKNLKKYDSSGKEITYSVKEYYTDSNGKLTELVKESRTSVGGYYLSSYTTSSDGDVITLTNKYIYSITVTKEWLEADGTAITNLKDTKDFSPVYIRLYGYVPNNKSSDSIDQIETLSYENGWKATITDLPQTNGKNQYIYYIQEVDSSGKALTESNLIQYYQIINGTASTKTTDPTKNIFYATGGAKGTLILSCVNTRSSYRLPETGSVGTTPFRMVGILLIGIAAGSALYMKRKKPLR